MREPAGYELLPEGMAFQRGEASAFWLQIRPNLSIRCGRRHAAANLDVNTAVSKIAGKPWKKPLLCCSSLPLKKEPQITIFPGWFPWLPWLSFRIQTEVNPQG
jgi:hypothetical protein